MAEENHLQELRIFWVVVEIGWFYFAVLSLSFPKEERHHTWKPIIVKFFMEHPLWVDSRKYFSLGFSSVSERWSQRSCSVVLQLENTGDTSLLCLKVPVHPTIRVSASVGFLCFLFRNSYFDITFNGMKKCTVVWRKTNVYLPSYNCSLRYANKLSASTFDSHFLKKLWLFESSGRKEDDPIYLQPYL